MNVSNLPRVLVVTSNNFNLMTGGGYHADESLPGMAR